MPKLDLPQKFSAMKISSNKAKGADKKVKSSKSSSIGEMPSGKNESWSVDKISNGYIVNKSWTDKEGRYQSTRTYSETNPLDEKDED